MMVSVCCSFLFFNISILLEHRGYDRVDLLQFLVFQFSSFLEHRGYDRVDLLQFLVFQYAIFFDQNSSSISFL